MLAAARPGRKRDAKCGVREWFRARTATARSSSRSPVTTWVQASFGLARRLVRGRRGRTTEARLDCRPRERVSPRPDAARETSPDAVGVGDVAEPRLGIATGSEEPARHHVDIVGARAMGGSTTKSARRGSSDNPGLRFLLAALRRHGPARPAHAHGPSHATAAANDAKRSPGSERARRQVTAIGSSPSCFTYVAGPRK